MKTAQAGTVARVTGDHAPSGAWPSQITVHELFEQQAARTPDDVAVETDTDATTYAELNRRANRLAHGLRQGGVGPEVAVGLCLDRSVDLLVGMLAILKAGGAYLPIDPDHPEAHVTALVRDARASIVVCERQLAERDAFCGMQHVTIDRNDGVDRADDTNVTPPADPNTLAYVMYTSGSTGRPKGVMVTHRNLVHSTLARLDYYERPVSSLLLLPPATFDASTAAIFWTLCSGGRLVLTPPRAEREPARIAALIAQHEPSHVLCASGLYDAVLDAAGSGDLESLDVVVVGGETCRPAMIARHRAKAPRAALFNEYGPTECTVWSSVYDATRWNEAGPVPIGHAIAETQLHVLGPDLEPVSIGSVGELYIGGLGVARGYLNQPELTAAAFIPHPSSRVPDARLYKTGDLARLRADGSIELVGRIDGQIKIRGVRIEPEEVEAALERHPSVRSAAVMAEDWNGGRRLVACVVAQGIDRLDPRALGRFLRSTLLAQMVPSRFVVVDAMPRTEAGKIDRQALAALATRPEARAPRAHTSIAPNPEKDHGLKRRLSEIWEEVLDVRAVGLEDNFFDLGGHSVLAAQLLTRVEALTGHRLSLATFLEAPTVAQLAAALRQPSPAIASPVVAVQRHGSRTPLFCVPGASQTGLHYGPLARRLGNLQPLYALDAQVASIGQPGWRLEQTAAALVAVVRSVQPKGPYMIAGNSFGGLIAFEVARQLAALGCTVGLLALFDTARPAPRAVRLWHITSGHLRRLAREREARTQFRSRVANALRRAARRTSRSANTRAGTTAADLDGGYSHQIAFLRYAPHPYPGHLTVFQAQDRSGESAPPPLLGWGHLASSVELHEVPGRHMTILREPHVGVLADRLKECLGRASGAVHARH